MDFKPNSFVGYWFSLGEEKDQVTEILNLSCGKRRTPGFWRQHRGTCFFELSYIYKVISYSKGMLLYLHRYVWNLQENAYSVLSGCIVYQSKVWTVLCLYECAMKCISENIQACVVLQMNAQVEAWVYPLWWLCIDISECIAVNKYISCDMICTAAYTQFIVIIIYSQSDDMND